MPKNVGTPALKLTTGKELREGMEVDMPSGATYRVRDVGVGLLVKLGRIPDYFTPMVLQLVTEGSCTIPPVTNIDEYRQRLELTDNIVTTALISPRIVENPTDDEECHIDNIPAADKNFLFQLLFKPVSDLVHSFRDEASDDGDGGGAEAGDSGAVVDLDTQRSVEGEAEPTA